jgi:hypothetical protein
MLVWSETCEECNSICNSVHFQQNFENWTSGNNDIDKFIKDAQLSAHGNISKVLEWIPYDRFYDIKYISKGKLGDMYRANWIDGRIDKWDNENQNWKRNNQNMVVVLINLSFFNLVTLKYVDMVY